MADKKASSIDSYSKPDLIKLLKQLGEYVEGLGDELQEKIWI